jgi:hypothetical protein
VAQFQLIPVALMTPEIERPRCPKCDMRMITVANPAPAKYECLRCSHTEPVSRH